MHTLKKTIAIGYWILFFLSQPHSYIFHRMPHLELYKTTDDQYYVQVFYRKSNEEHLEALNVPGCGTKFSVQEFLDFYKEIIPENDFDSECRL